MENSPPYNNYYSPKYIAAMKLTTDIIRKIEDKKLLEFLREAAPESRLPPSLLIRFNTLSLQDSNELLTPAEKRILNENKNRVEKALLTIQEKRNTLIIHGVWPWGEVNISGTAKDLVDVLELKIIKSAGIEFGSMEAGVPPCRKTLAGGYDGPWIERIGNRDDFGIN